MKQQFMQYSCLFVVAPVCMLVGAAVFAADPDSAGDQTRRQELSTKLVEEALRREVNGQAQARDEILTQALERDSSNATARWQSGFVWDGTEWVRVDESCWFANFHSLSPSSVVVKECSSTFANSHAHIQDESR